MIRISLLTLFLLISSLMMMRGFNVRLKSYSRPLGYSLQVVESKQTSHYLQVQKSVKYQGHLHSSSSAQDQTPSTSNRKNTKIQDLKAKLAKAGQAGLLSYGILNSIYYISLTSFVWYWTGTGTAATATTAGNLSPIKRALTRLGKVSITVWIGSQATKLFRLLGAVATAPIADRFIIFIQGKFHLKDRNQSFLYICYSLWIIAATFYGWLILTGSLF